MCRYRRCTGRLTTNFENTVVLNSKSHLHDALTDVSNVENIYKKMTVISPLRNFEFGECLRKCSVY